MGTADQSRNPALDGVRGIAICLVMIHHFGQMAGFQHFHAAIDSAWIGVDLFFVLSGFLITGGLLDAKGRPHYFRNFYARRTLRIFPVYYSVIIIAMIYAAVSP